MALVHPLLPTALLPVPRAVFIDSERQSHTQSIKQQVCLLPHFCLLDILAIFENDV